MNIKINFELNDKIVENCYTNPLYLLLYDTNGLNERYFKNENGYFISIIVGQRNHQIIGQNKELKGLSKIVIDEIRKWDPQIVLKSSQDHGRLEFYRKDVEKLYEKRKHILGS